MIDFPLTVRNRMAALNLSQRRLSLLTGGAVSQQHLSNWLAGRYRLSDDKLAAVLVVLGLKDLMFEDQET
jgi:transcriptional regulator with XRE-family HTH domain